MKRHLLVRGKAACGLTTPLRWTMLVHLVTCGGCQRTIHMADAEVTQRQSRTTTNRRSFTTVNRKGRS